MNSRALGMRWPTARSTRLDGFAESAPVQSVEVERALDMLPAVIFRKVNGVPYVRRDPLVAGRVNVDRGEHFSERPNGSSSKLKGKRSGRASPTRSGSPHQTDIPETRSGDFPRLTARIDEDVRIVVELGRRSSRLTVRR